MKPPTPQSLGRPAPPRSATPASVLNAHKLVGGATRVVMLKHRDNAPRPAVSFGGKSVSAVAMLVGGGLELPLPLYCVDDVSKALVDLRPEGAPALRTVDCRRAQITTRIVHDLLRDPDFGVSRQGAPGLFRRRCSDDRLSAIWRRRLNIFLQSCQRRALSGQYLLHGTAILRLARRMF